MKNILLCIAAIFLMIQTSFAGSIAPSLKICTEAEGRAMMASKTGGVLWFSAPWCPTCAVQGQSIATLIAEKKMEAPMPICKIDYDTSFPLQRSLNVWSQSSMVKVAGGQVIEKKTGATDTFGIGRFIER